MRAVNRSPLTPLLCTLLFLILDSPPMLGQWSTVPDVDNVLATSGSSPAIASDGAGGAFVAWLGTNRVCVQHLSASGVQVWGQNGVILDSTGSSYQKPSLISDGQGGALIVWSSFETSYRVSIAHVTNRGTFDRVRTIESSSMFLGTPGIVEDGTDGALIAWTHSGTVSSFVNVVRYHTASGSLLWDHPAQAISTTTNLASPTIAPDGFGGAYVGAPADSNLLLSRIASTGTVVWGNYKVGGMAMNFRILPDGVGGMFGMAQAREEPLSGGGAIKAFRMNPNGGYIFDRTVATDVGPPSYELPEHSSAAVSDQGDLAIVWHQDSTGSGNRIYCQVLDPSGAPLCGSAGMLLSASATDLRFAHVASGFDGTFLVIWQDQTFKIIARKIDRWGNPIWRWIPRRLQDPEINNVQFSGGSSEFAQVISDGSGGAIMTNRVTSQIVAKRLLASGRLGGPEPRVTSIADVASDQGGNVRIRWDRSWYDTTGIPYPVTMYGVWRKFMTGSPQLSAGSEGRSTKTALPRMSSALVINDTLAVNYDCVGTVPAIESPQYSFVAPTLADSSAGDHAVTEFVVTAHTVKPSAFFISFPDSGYSIDNLPPLAPVMAGFRPGPDSSWTIHWQPASGQTHDFRNYVIYRSTVSDFTPDEATKLADVHDTIYVDADVHDGSAYYYAITARDLAGNESAPATVSVLVNTLASGEGLPTECVLLQNYPNPFNPLTIVDYRLSIRGKVRLSVFDLLGREAAVLVDEEMPAGRYSVEWNASGMSSGVYLYRLQAGGVVQTRRMVLLR